MRRHFTCSVDPSKLEGFPERQAEREKKRRRLHVVRRTRQQPEAFQDTTGSEPVRGDVLYEMAWMNRGSRT